MGGVLEGRRVGKAVGMGLDSKEYFWKKPTMELQIHPHFLFSAEYYLIQNIGVAANFLLKLKQLEINDHNIFILTHFILSHTLFPTPLWFISL